ncbi:MAG: phosphoribosyltransferase family protein [Gemmataceae bacterium]|nr:phosphoribosyltransferase family protein [Gemmataceae bacterium]MCS7270980.1 phosphoribosyltransferase family protein [Gemmataceae bacterium]MDW8243567.1 phosphoribosyltransferase family protein [Thermogemmata sp.]
MAVWEGNRFRDRREAGQLLAEQLRHIPMVRPVVLAIPRGGVVVGAALAEALQAELDVILSRKLRAPFQPEYALGAIAEDGSILLNPEALPLIQGADEYLEAERRYQLQEIARRQGLIRAIRPAAEVTGRTVIITDDGVATGSTALAALQTVHARHPRELILAVPVGPPERLRALARHCDRLIYLLAPDDFHAVGQYYDSFEPVEDEDVAQLLRDAYQQYQSSFQGFTRE